MPTGDGHVGKIDAHSRTIRQLLGADKFGVDYYQRDYKWETKQVAELLDDLADHFLGSYEPEHDRNEVERYSHYFLGSVIISEKEGRKFIIDGQQRLTTLTLLLIHLNNLQGTPPQVTISDLVFSEKFGAKSFNLDVPERTKCMEALFTGAPFDDTDEPESVANILARYADIQELFPDELTGSSLPYFIDWLIESVHLVEITAYSDEDAYTIFETMNDRGLSLSPTDMLKGYLLANIRDVAKRRAATDAWKKWVGRLVSFGKEEDADAIKSWLRSQYAQNIRERKRGAVPQDFDRIGTEFHRWVRDEREQLGLDKALDFARFIEEDFSFYAGRYLELREASTRLVAGLESVFYNAQLNFTMQYPVLLAALRPGDSEELLLEKLRIVGAYLDVLIARRIWNFRAIDYSTMQYAMFIVMRDIRGKEPQALAAALRKRLDAEDEVLVRFA